MTDGNTECSGWNVSLVRGTHGAGGDFAPRSARTRPKDRAASIPRFLALFALLAAGATSLAAEETVGKRPYEMVWANRTEDTHAPLIDFENLDGWTVETHDAAATLARSRRQQLWGKYVGELVYRGDGTHPAVTCLPPAPIEIPQPFDSVNFWVYGNNWAWAPDRSTPRVAIHLRLRSPGGQVVDVSLGVVRWKEWWVMHRRLSPEQIALLKDGAVLEAIEVRDGRNEDDRTLWFDNLAFYRETLPPLTFEPRPKRGIEPFAGQSAGTNTGPGKLPFPTREETLLPDNLSQAFEVSLEESHGQFAFHYRGDDGHLVYRYQPATGTLGDITAEWVGRGDPFQPMAEGGIRGLSPRGEPIEATGGWKLSRCRRVGETVVSTWKCLFGDQPAEVTYTLRLWQKSLVVDVRCLGGRVSEVRFGKAVGVDQPRLVTLPYLTGGSRRPAVLVGGPAQKPLFLFGLVDHYRSNASELFAENSIAEEGVVYNGGSRYLPKTDGRRNDCFERLFLTISPRFEEVLPNIANPKSPWMQVTGDRLWRAHGASNREQDYAYWKRVARYGMTKVVITDHETGWRDGGESFTFRTRAAPGKGGDQGQADYARKIHALGFVYGIYNNYTDYAPVNEYWDEDCVTRTSTGEWRTAWARCYNPKPARAVEFEARLAPIIQRKFHLNTAYCDVHTAVRPWSYCDFDARVPGAGTFAATFYAYGEIMLHQKKTWGGPVYSEGNNHWYYCGLTDGNYGQDQVARLPESPWLVDFDLRKMHPLCCNFGMGNPGMFFGRKVGMGSTPEQRSASLDQFLAATLAFGHTGFLVMQNGIGGAVRSYYALEQVHTRYAREIATDIRYADSQGNLLKTSAAVATGAYRRRQIATRYGNGMKVVVNGHPTETWKIAEAVLPPFGWFAEDTREGKLLAFSALVDGHRADYVDSPEYVYADGRGRFTRFAKAAADGQVVALARPNGRVEVIPVGDCTSFGVSLDGATATAVALDEAGDELGPAKTRFSRGLVYVVPVDKAFSYLLTPGPAPAVSLRCDRTKVVPGETVQVAGHGEHEVKVPADAVPGTRLWHTFENGWIDFSVVALVDAQFTVDKALHLKLASHLPRTSEAEISLNGQTQTAELSPQVATTLDFPLDLPPGEAVRELSLKVTAGPLVHTQRAWLKAEESMVSVAEFPPAFESGQCLRKSGREEAIDGATGGGAYWSELPCGGVTKKCLAMHPTYKTGPGYTFAVFGPVALPQTPRAVLRCEIGKGDGSDPGDGILFRVAIVDSAGKETTVAEKQWIEHAWTPLRADLSPWAGQSVKLKLITDPGPADNTSGDWARWAGMRIESADPVLLVTVHDRPVELRRCPGPHGLPGLTPKQLRGARTGTLHFEAIGLQHGAPYISTADLNGVPLGELPGAGGNQQQGTWGEVAVPLPPAALASLDRWNHLTVANPGQDCFKMRRAWIELQWADGRIGSSEITVPIYTQPGTWKYAQGTGVPFGEDIAIEIRFP